MNFFQAIESCFKQYANFKDRSVRSEYWYFVLFAVLGHIVANTLDSAIFHASFPSHPLDSIFTVIILIPSIAVGVRRLHDVDRSGWWLLISFTIIGMFFPLLFWNCTEGTKGGNHFGQEPLKVA